MKFEKKVISDLNKCYAISDLTFQGEHCFLVAAEKDDPCYLFSEDGTKLETVWEKPGGVMTMTPVPGADGQFLATEYFYSPNDSLNAKIVIVTRKAANDWERRTLAVVPFVHRFGILRRGGVNYLLACALKTGHEYKNDWRFPGACFGAVLPADLTPYNDENPLEMTLVMDEMLQNHGFCKLQRGGHDAALIGCEQGTFMIEPPAVLGADWEVTEISSVPSSDSVLIDFDGDGKAELGCISPFHGNSLVIYHLDEFGNYVPQWKLAGPEKDTEMIHATWACEIAGRPPWIVGWRKGTRKTIAVSWDAEAGDYRTDLIDENTGCANAMHFVSREGKDVIVATNREISEVALYTVTE